MRPLGKLKDIQVRTAGIGVHGDGGGLVLSVKHQRAAKRREEAKQSIPTFDECAASYVASHMAGWRSVQHSREWTRSLTAHVTPVFGSTPADMIDTTLVCKALEPLWNSKIETASRIRGRIENVLDWAKVRGYRVGENPARWRGHLENLFPKRSKVRAVAHFRALPYALLPNFMAQLRNIDGMTARCLEFVILTAARSNEALTAKWCEIDLQAKTWTLPGSKMKGGREHKVPLAATALTLLEALPRNGEYVFTGQRPREYLSPAAMKMLLIRMQQRITTHEFRSSFRDWCAERTNYPNELAEMALAHRVGSQVENAYRRTDMFERRRRLMADWAAFCETPTSNAEVIPIRA